MRAHRGRVLLLLSALPMAGNLRLAEHSALELAWMPAI